MLQKNVRTINEHIKNIYSEGELDPKATIRKFRIVQEEGQRNLEISDLNLIVNQHLDFKVYDP